MCGAWPGTLVTWPWLRLSMIYCCALRLWSLICVTCRRCWFPVSAVLSCCVEARCLWLRGWLHMFEMVTEHFANPNLCGCCEMLVFRVCGVRRNLYVYSIYRNPNIDNRIFDYLLASMAAVQAEDVFPHFSCLWVIWMAIIRSGWVLRPRTVMELPPLTSQQSLVAISLMSAQPMHVVEHLTSWWLMFLT